MSCEWIESRHFSESYLQTTPNDVPHGQGVAERPGSSDRVHETVEKKQHAYVAAVQHLSRRLSEVGQIGVHPVTQGRASRREPRGHLVSARPFGRGEQTAQAPDDFLPGPEWLTDFSERHRIMLPYAR